MHGMVSGAVMSTRVCDRNACEELKLLIQALNFTYNICTILTI